MKNNCVLGEGLLLAHGMPFCIEEKGSLPPGDTALLQGAWLGRQSGSWISAPAGFSAGDPYPVHNLYDSQS